MSEPRTGSTDKPPSPRVKRSSHLAVVVAGSRSSSGSTSKSGRRGRPSQEDYTKRVCEVLRRSPMELEDCTTLAQLPGVQSLAKQLKRGVFPTGNAIRMLLDIAANEVETMAWNQKDASSHCIATFLHLWYVERQTVVAIADYMGFSRSHVAHCIQKKALEAVARRFLERAWCVEVPA